MGVLNEELRQDLARLLNHFLEMEKETPEQAQRAWKIWQSQDIYEFVYGHWVGYFTGVFEGIIQGRYNREVSFDERNEIIELVEEYAPQLREHLLHIKSRGDGDLDRSAGD